MPGRNPGDEPSGMTAAPSTGTGGVRLVVGLCCLLAAACAGDAEPAAPAVEVGEPLPGLTAAELDRFQRGEALFARVFTPEEGLGPLFNENACNACHTDPVNGGTGEQLLVKATRSGPGSCDLLAHVGAENVQRQATPALRAHGIEGEIIPAEATERGRFSVPILYGLGLVEAIPDEEISRRADPDDRNGDGISGRVARSVQGSVGRFGRKGESPTLEHFIDTALRFEMGLTTPARPVEEMINGQPLPDGVDPTPEPEISSGDVALLRDYVRYLAPPVQRIPDDADLHRQIARGERLFIRSGCSGCHVAEMKTDRQPEAALSNRKIRLYSDLLLHDMGPGLADVCGLTASPSELRTAPLMGLVYRKTYLHDARTRSIPDAILMHGGEASAARDNFARLPRLAQEDLVRFLRSL